VSVTGRVRMFGEIDGGFSDKGPEPSEKLSGIFLACQGTLVT